MSIYQNVNITIYKVSQYTRLYNVQKTDIIYILKTFTMKQ